MLDTAMRLEQEVRHKSEDIEDNVLLDAVRAIRRRVRVINRGYDIPYIAGYPFDSWFLPAKKHSHGFTRDQPLTGMRVNKSTIFRRVRRINFPQRSRQHIALDLETFIVSVP